MNKNKIKKNLIWGFGGRFIIIILGFIVPHLMIKGYGSDVNGLISTVTQIFTYLALLEAGIGQAARNALYKPFVEKDKESILTIASAAQRYYRKVTAIYGITVVLMTVLLPFVIKSNVDKPTIMLIVLFQGLANVISFCFIQTKTVLLQVDGRGYIIQVATVVNKAISYAIQIILALLGLNIVFLQIAYFFINISLAIFYYLYFKKRYSWIDFTVPSKGIKLSDRNSFIVTEVAWTIFSSTDMIVLSMFLSTKFSSVYSVYSMVFTQLALLLSAVYTNFHYILGKSYYESIDKYKKIHDLFTSLCLGSMTVFMAVVYILIIPFVKLYTHGVSDAEYIYSALPIMFCMIQMLSWSRMVSGHLTGVAGYAKQVSYISLVEAIINIVLSVTLVNFMGINGVLLATVVALPFKVIYCTYLSEKKILKRSYKNSLLIFSANYAVFGLSILLNRLVNFNISSYLSMALYGMVLMIGFGILVVIANYVMNPNLRYFLKKKLKCS